MDEKDYRRLMPEYLPIFFDEVQFGTRLSSALRHFMARKENHYFFILVHHFYGTPILLGSQIFFFGGGGLMFQIPFLTFQRLNSITQV